MNVAASALPKDKPNLRMSRQEREEPAAKIAPLAPGLVANNLVKQFRKRPVLRGVRSSAGGLPVVRCASLTGRPVLPCLRAPVR